MADYSAFPVWDRGMVRPSSLAISEQLRDDLQAWNDEWADTGGVSPDVYERPASWDHEKWRGRGRVLAARLADELGEGFDVRFEEP